MRKVLMVGVVLLGAMGWAGVDDATIIFRGDVNGDGNVNVADPVYLQNYLFRGGPQPPCFNQADANNDGLVDNTDAVYLYSYLYLGGSPPPNPGAGSTCTIDDLPYPGCDVAPCSP